LTWWLFSDGNGEKPIVKPAIDVRQTGKSLPRQVRQINTTHCIYNLAAREASGYSQALAWQGEDIHE
jgi:hypothetical protein